MGMKKTGKRLLKLGQKAARKLGEGGKEWVDKVLLTACHVIEEELKKSEKEAARERTASTPRGRRVKADQPTAKSKAASGSKRKLGKRASAKAPAKERAAKADNEKRSQRRSARTAGAPSPREALPPAVAATEPAPELAPSS